MVRQGLMITAGLVGLYLVVAYATGFGRSLQAAGSVYTSGVRALQGR